MTSTFVLLLASLVTMQAPSPNSGDFFSYVSCNKQGTAFDSVWLNQGYVNNQNVVKILYSRNTNGTAPSDGNATVYAVNIAGGVETQTIQQPVQVPPAVVDTDDTSSTDPNFAVVWCAQPVPTPTNPNPPVLPYCSVNGRTPFTAGNSTTQGSAACVAVSRQYQTLNGTSYMVVAIAFQDGLTPIYAQVFTFNSSTGAAGPSSSPVKIDYGGQYGSEDGQLALGGIAGDDYGNFVVSYVRQATAPVGNAPPVGHYVSGFNYANLINNSTLGFREVQVDNNGSQYTYSRVACYHGTSATSGGFVVALGHGSDQPTAQRYTTNWGTTTTLAATTTFNGNYSMPDFATLYPWFQIGCVRNTPGNYTVTWCSPPGSGMSSIDDVVYSSVSGDRAGAVTYLTDYMFIPGTCHPSAYAVMPSFATSDSTAGPIYQFNYIYFSDYATCTPEGVGYIRAAGNAVQ
jgi:hypothetical protein